MRIAVALTCLAALCTPACSKAGKSGTGQDLPRVRASEVIQVAAVPPSRHVLALQPVRRARLSPRYGGVVASLDFTPQERVKQGQVLVHFVASEPRARLSAARAALRVAETELRGKKVERDRTEKLAKGGLASEQQLAEITSEVDVLEAKAAEARAGITVATDQLDAMQLIAPFDGAVTEYFVQLGDYVDPPSPVLVFCDLGEYYVELPLTEREAVLRDTGQLKIATSIRGAQVPAEVAWVSRATSNGAPWFTARLRILDPDQRFRGGESAEVVVRPTQEASSLAVPATALRWHGGESFVLRLNGSRDTLQRVSIRVLGDYAERVTIEGDLHAGELVALGGPTSLDDGTRVEALVTK